MRIIFALFVFACFCTTNLNAQNIDKDYTFLQSLNTGLNRKMYANEVMFDEQQNYLIVNYGHKPTYIIVFKYGSWEALVNFRLPNWVEFSGSYLDASAENIYIKTSRYSTEYYKLNIPSSEQEIRECQTLPEGCPVVEPKKSPKDIFSLDKNYYVAINKKNERDVRVFQKR